MTATATPPGRTSSPPTGGAPPNAAPTSSSGGSPSLVPTRAEWLDIGALGALIVLAVFGFGTAYGGVHYFIAGVIGALLGLAVAHVCARTRQPLIVVVAAVVVVFFLFGPALAVPNEAFFGVLPSPGAVLALIDGVVQGWAKLITTLPPVGSAGNLLTVPFVCGLIAGVLSLTIARRSKRPLFAVLPPLLVLGLSILFGTSAPASLLLQGAVFSAVMIGWISIRQRRTRQVGVRTSASKRWVGVVAMLVLVASVALVFGESIPGASSNERFVLRDRTEPPFDPRDYPSPLNGYRRYTKPEMLQQKTVLTVEGAQPGDKLRLATLDAYDGVVYTVGSGAGSSGYFQRVGQQVPLETETPGDERTLTVTVGEYADVWVPTIGQLKGIEFLGDERRAEDLQDSFRYNTMTGTAAAQALLRSGDRYRIEAVLPEFDAELLGDGSAAAVQQPDAAAIAPVQELGAQFAGDESSAYQRARNIAQQLFDNGAISDGNEGQSESRPGHGAERLVRMVDPDVGVLVGNGEQYAPLAALMARSVGVPARVVMGFEVPQDAPDGPVEITGEAVTAWIEVAVDGAGWVPVDGLIPDNPTPKEVPQPKPRPQPVAPPPPPPPLPPSEEDDTDPEKVETEDPKSCAELEAAGAEIPERCAGSGIPWGTIAKVGGLVTLPFWVLGAITAVIAGLKLRRRRRRMTRGGPTERIAGGWAEVTDLACDLGSPVPPRSTRREAAAFVGNAEVADLAREADSEIFGADAPDDVQVEGFWRQVDRTRAAMVSELTAFEKWKAIVSLASLRSTRRSRRSRRATSASRVPLGQGARSLRWNPSGAGR
jgi:transglutaminase-like putative cysteine protease